MALLACLLALPGCSRPEAPRNVIYQTSTLRALLESVYDGEVSCGQLKQHGDMGIGTFNAMNGEMVLLDGKCYRVRGDGGVQEVADTELTPFAAVVRMSAPRKALLPAADFKGLQQALDALRDGANYPCAIRIDGIFEYVKTRSVPRQQRPYPRLTEIAKQQPTFEFKNVTGTLVGFWLPEYLDGINMTGYHLHFITADRSGGGHVLDCRIADGRATLATAKALKLALPGTNDFRDANLNAKNAAEVEQVEKAPAAK